MIASLVATGPLERGPDRPRPDVIFLLTDGEFDQAVAGLVKRLNADGNVTVHTIGFLYKTGEAVLKQIAEQNGGKYGFVSEADLAKMADQ